MIRPVSSGPAPERRREIDPSRKLVGGSEEVADIAEKTLKPLSPDGFSLGDREVSLRPPKVASKTAHFAKGRLNAGG